MSKKTVLVVEDTAGFDLLIDLYGKKSFPPEEYEIKIVGDFTHAAEVLCDPNRTIAAVIIDNGFPLISGGTRVGATRGDVPPEGYSLEDVNARKAEGGAGAMLLRFMRTGNPGALSTDSIMELQDLKSAAEIWLGDGYNQRMAELVKTEIVWNSADPRAGKIEGIKATAAGIPIDPYDNRYDVEKEGLARNQVLQIDEHTAVAGKAFRHIFEYLAEKIVRDKEAAAPEFPLCIEHGRQPKPEIEFSLAAQYQDIDALKAVKENHPREISAERISSAIGMIASNPDAKGIRIVSEALTFPLADVNALHILPLTEPQRVCTPLYEAVAKEADWLVNTLLEQPSIKLTQDVVDLASATGNTVIAQMLSDHLQSHPLSEGVSMQRRNELPDPSTIKGFGLEVREIPPARENQV